MDAKTELDGFEERFAEVRGCRMRYLVAGDGETLVLVHGLAGAAANWLALAPLLLPGPRPWSGTRSAGRSRCGWPSGGPSSCRRSSSPVLRESPRGRGRPATR